MDINNGFPYDHTILHCPITGLKIESKKEWINVDLGYGYTTSYFLIGGHILLGRPKGTATAEGITNLLSFQEKFLKEHGIWNQRFVEIKDYSYLRGLPPHAARVRFKDYLQEEQDKKNLLGYLGFNASWRVKTLFNAGISTYRPQFPTMILGTYQDAITQAVELCLSNNISLEYRQQNREEWKLSCSSYSIEFTIYSDDILFAKTKGTLSSECVQASVDLSRKVLLDAKISKEEGYYRIIDGSNLKSIDRASRKLYINAMNKLQAEIPCKGIIMFGHNRFINLVITVYKSLFHLPFHIVNSFEDALKLTYQQKTLKARETKRGTQKEKKEKKKYSEKEILNYRDYLQDILSSINWNEKVALNEEEMFKKAGPFRPVLESLIITQNDFELFASEKKEEKKRVLNIINTIPIVIIVFDLDGKIDIANMEAKRILGHPEAELKEISIESIIENKELAKDLINKIPITQCETKLISRHKNKIPVLLSSSILYDSEGEINATIFAAIDISEIKIAEKEKDEMQKQIFHTSRLASLGELAASIGHEINNPLAVINGYVEIFEKHLKKRDKLDKSLSKYLAHQKESVTRIMNIVNGLRSHARSDNDKIETVNINKAIERTLAFLEVILFQEEVKIEKLLAAQDIYIRGNNEKIQQVFVNLLSNAKDATLENHANNKERKIIIETMASNDKAIIKFKDNGTGIPEDLIDRIFDRFYTSKPRGQGTGLGLGVIKNIITNIEGTINVQSEVGQGTTFELHIPIDKEPIGKTVKKSKEIKKENLSGNVLVVDDEKEIRKILSNILSSLGMQVDLASNGVEALNNIKGRDNQYDYIFTDLKMPVMDGYQFLDQLKKLPGTMPKIFIISGTINRNKKALKVDDVIEKPFFENDIYDLLIKHKKKLMNL